MSSNNKPITNIYLRYNIIVVIIVFRSRMNKLKLKPLKFEFYTHDIYTSNIRYIQSYFKLFCCRIKLIHKTKEF